MALPTLPTRLYLLLHLPYLPTAIYSACSTYLLLATYYLLATYSPTLSKTRFARFSLDLPTSSNIDVVEMTEGDRSRHLGAGATATLTLFGGQHIDLPAAQWGGSLHARGRASPPKAVVHGLRCHTTACRYRTTAGGSHGSLYVHLSRRRPSRILALDLEKNNTHASA